MPRSHPSASHPNSAATYNKRGNVLHELGQYQEAIAHYEQAIALDAGFALAYHNRAIALQNLKKHAQAIASFARAIELSPPNVNAHLDQALCYLQMGNFEMGWREHEWRWQKGDDIGFGHFPEPRWTGLEPLQGKNILLHSEQGLGDTLQFCRYVKQVADLGARIILAVQQPLRALLSQLEGIPVLLTLSAGDRLPAFDYQCPLISLPLAFKTTLDSIPAPLAYIKSSADKVT